jgi:hypothetical protein
VKYVDDLLLLPRGETVLQNMTDRLIENVRWYGMEIKMLK